MQFTQISQCQLENKEQQFRFMLYFKELYAELRKNFQDLDKDQIVKSQLNTVVHQQGPVSSYFCNLHVCDILAWLIEMMKPRTLAFTRVCIVKSKMKMPDCSNPSHSKTS